MYALEVGPFEVPAGHTLNWHPKCKRPHGHNYLIWAEFRSMELNENGVVQDLGELKKALEKVVMEYDHSWLNEVDGLENPTVELFAARVFNSLIADPNLQVAVWSVTIQETGKARVKYEPYTIISSTGYWSATGAGTACTGNL